MKTSSAEETKRDQKQDYYMVENYLLLWYGKNGPLIHLGLFVWVKEAKRSRELYSTLFFGNSCTMYLAFQYFIISGLKDSTLICCDTITNIRSVFLYVLDQSH